MAGNDAATPRRRDRTHYLYIAVIVAVLAGIAVGLAAPDVGKALKPLGTGFVNLIKMMISPVIFCTIVLGVGGVRKAAKVGKVGGLALAYFMVMSVVALIIGMLVGNVLHPGTGVHLSHELAGEGAKQAGEGAESTTDFLLGIIPKTLVSALTEGEVLQTLLVALLAGFALQALGEKGEPILRGIEHAQRLVFKILSMVMWAAPVGAFGAIAATTGKYGVRTLQQLAALVGTFWLTSLLFVVVVLGLVLRLHGLGLFKLLRYLREELLIVLGTSSTEPVLPRMMTKLEDLGAAKKVVGLTIPSGYSFNLDGTAIYLTMGAVFLTQALDVDLSLWDQLGMLAIMLLTSKGAAGVTGSGFVALAATLSAVPHVPVAALALIVGVVRFMSE